MLSQEHAPENQFGEKESNPHSLGQNQTAYRLADPRVRPAGVEPACPVWKTVAFTARPRTQKLGSRDSNPDFLVNSQARYPYNTPQYVQRARVVRDGVAPPPATYQIAVLLLHHRTVFLDAGQRQRAGRLGVTPGPRMKGEVRSVVTGGGGRRRANIESNSAVRSAWRPHD